MKIFKTCLLTAVFSVLMTCMAFAASDKNPVVYADPVIVDGHTSAIMARHIFLCGPPANGWGKM